jgi:hypothetical protein
MVMTEYLFEEAQKHSWGENGKVISIIDDIDKNKPEFVIAFDCQPELELLDEEDDEPSMECEVRTFHLFEDYLNNDSRLL